MKATPLLGALNRLVVCAKMLLLKLALAVTAVLFLSVIASVAGAENPIVLWAKTAGPAGAGGIALTPAGELLVVEEQYPYPNAFVLKFNSEGSLVASNAFLGADVNAAAVHTNGAIYLTGWIGTNGTFNFPTEEGFFLAKYDENYNRLWVSTESPQPPGTIHRSYANRVVVDAQGNVYAGGVSQGPTTLGSTTFGDSSGTRPLFCKYDGSGNLVWAKRIEFWPSGQLDGGEVYDLAVDPSGNVLISGFMREGTADFGGITVYPGSTGHSYDGDSFLAKYDPDGNLLWVQLGYTVGAVDRLGEIYAEFSWAVDGYAGMAKFDPAGGLLWSKTLPPGIGPGGMTLDPTDQPVFTGWFINTVTLDGITLQSRSIGWEDFYVAKANTQGTIQWAVSGGGTEFDEGNSVLCDSLGNVYFSGIIRKDPGSFGAFPLTPAPGIPSYDPTLVVAKIAQEPSLKLVRSAQNVALSWPVGATNYVLEAATSLPAISWDAVTNNPTIGATERSVQLPITNSAKFFRLRSP